MDQWTGWMTGLALSAPTTAILLVLWTGLNASGDTARLWRGLQPALRLGWLGAFGSLLAYAAHAFAGPKGFEGMPMGGGFLILTPLTAVLALLVQSLACVIASFSSRYLQGDEQGAAGQRRYVLALAGVLSAVHMLLLADHWVVLIGAWALVGWCLQPLLGFYTDRPFALLAAHKKRLADRAADGFAIAAAALAWHETGSGSLSALTSYLAQAGQAAVGTGLQACAVCLVLAVVLRTALMPVHGWLIQVMEAPTPVSALLHAGVVNLGGFVLIRQAALIEASPLARWLLVCVGLITACLAGMVMMTRISIKVRLAWSTVAQMGFMVMECGLGLYSLAAWHLLGHSLYKAHAFLSSGGAVRQTRLQQMRGATEPQAWGPLCAPALAWAGVMAAQWTMGGPTWPGWWHAVLALAWAPLLWVPHASPNRAQAIAALLAGGGMVMGLTWLAALAHILPLGLKDSPWHLAGWLVLLAMTGMHAALVVLQRWPHKLSVWRRWSYAGFYVDEVYTRVALSVWPTRWTPRRAHANHEWAPSASMAGIQD